MGKQPFISHAVNGYSRYDVPESKAFTCTPGILYPVRIDFINARDRVSIEQGIDVRSNPLAVPTFNPYTVRLHRFWVPLQLYHPELRTNSSKFDMNNLSLNWIPSSSGADLTFGAPSSAAYPNSLMFWLRIGNKSYRRGTSFQSDTELSSTTPLFSWSNADTYLAYWDIVRNYYSYSQWSLFSFAWPGSSYLLFEDDSVASPLINTAVWNYLDVPSYFNRRIGNLEFLDAYFESQFYPSAVSSSNNTFSRLNLFDQILHSDIAHEAANYGANGNGYPIAVPEDVGNIGSATSAPANQLSISGTSAVTYGSLFMAYHPMAVIPSNPDRFSRLLPTGSNSAVSMTGVSTIPQLAIASRLQEYKDLLGAGGSRYSDWLETFFASKIEHVDRPKLLFSASQTVNVQIVMNQAGANNFASDQYSMPSLGQQGGSIAFNTQLGRRQSYYFREPGYLIDMFSIRPVYYWAAVTPDYINYTGSDYFNPIYNDIGYQSVPSGRIFAPRVGSSTYLNTSVANEPCFNEFRASYDEVLGQISAVSGSVGSKPLYSYWVQQRSGALLQASTVGSYYDNLFVDLSQVNSSFSSNVEDNFFVNLAYNVYKKNLVNKTFATRLSNR